MYKNDRFKYERSCNFSVRGISSCKSFEIKIILKFVLSKERSVANMYGTMESCHTVRKLLRPGKKNLPCEVAISERLQQHQH